MSAVDPTLTAWIRFNAGEVAFNNSCNIGGGTAEIGDTDITFGPLRSTLIFCDGPSGALETVMNAVLQGVTPYTVTTDPSGTRLKIMSADGVTGLGFVADPTVGADAFAVGRRIGGGHRPRADLVPSIDSPIPDPHRHDEGPDSAFRSRFTGRWPTRLPRRSAAMSRRGGRSELGQVGAVRHGASSAAGRP